MLFFKNLLLRYQLKTIDQCVDHVFPKEFHNTAKHFFHRHMQDNRKYCTVNCRKNSIKNESEFFQRGSFRFEKHSSENSSKRIICCDNYSDDTYCLYDPSSQKITLESNTEIICDLANSFTEFVQKICHADPSFEHKFYTNFEHANMTDSTSIIASIESSQKVLEFDFIEHDCSTVSEKSFFYRAFFSFELPPEKYIRRKDSHWWAIGSGMGDDDTWGIEGSILVNKKTGHIGLGTSSPEAMPSFFNGYEYVTIISDDFDKFTSSLTMNDAEII